MKFEPFTKADEVFKAMSPGHPGMRHYSAHVGDWNFIVAYDEMHLVWSATWQPRILVPGKRYSAQSCEPPSPGENIKPYATRDAAEAACRRKYRELREAN